MLEELRQVAMAHIQAQAFVRALGGGGEVPSWWEIRAAFDEALAAAPASVAESKVDVMRMAVGLRG